MYAGAALVFAQVQHHACFTHTFLPRQARSTPHGGNKLELVKPSVVKLERCLHLHNFFVTKGEGEVPIPPLPYTPTSAHSRMDDVPVK